jgi:WD40 repeat protein
VAEAIFISYRRDDTADVAGRVHDAFASRFGSRRIFMDVDNLRPGADFGTHIKTLLPRCQTALILIGPSWLEARDERGARRLDLPNDWVRIEIETALATPSLDVVPVLVNGASMPRAEELPECLRPMVLRHAAVIRRNPDFRDDVGRLAVAIRRSMKSRRRLPSRRTILSGVVGTVSAGTLAGAAIYAGPRWKSWFPYPDVSAAGKKQGLGGISLFATLQGLDPFMGSTYSPDSSRLLTSTWNLNGTDVSTLWDVETSERIAEWPSKDNSNFIYSARPTVFSPNGKLLLSISDKWKSASIRDGRTGDLVRLLQGHTGSIVSASFSPNGNQIVTCADDYTVRVWDSGTGSEIRSIRRPRWNQTQGWANVARFSPDGQLIAADAGNGVHLIDASTGEDVSLSSTADTSGSLAFSPNGLQLLFGKTHLIRGGSSSNAAPELWHTAELMNSLDGSTKSLSQTPISTHPEAGSFAPAGDRVLLGFDDGTVRIFRTWDGAQIASIRPSSERITNSAVYLGDGSVFATHGVGDVVRLWSARDLSLLATLHDGKGFAASYSLDGSRAFVATTMPSPCGRIWRLN